MCLADGRVEKSKYVNQNKKDTTEDSTTCWLSLGNEQGREGWFEPTDATEMSTSMTVAA